LVVDPLQEIRPDGNRVLFDYDGQRNLNKMVLTDSTEQIELLSYTLQHKEDEITVSGSNGQEVHYAKGNFPFKLPHQLTQYFKRLARVEGTHLIPTQYSYYKSTGGIAGKLESIQQPEGRQLRVEYYGDSRVHQLKAPIGNDDQLLPFATFTYGDKTRTWTGPEGEQTQYHLDDHQRTRAIQKYHEGTLVAAEIDANKVKTTYNYDGAGRLIETCIGDRRTTIEYDTLGRPYKTTEWIDQSNARMSIQEYDLLNRVIEKRIEDTAGTIFQRNRYGYDRCGNRNTILEGNSLTQIAYDSRNRPICTTML